jgi:protein-disulfide isomerase
MSRKSKRSRSNPDSQASQVDTVPRASGISRRALVASSVVALLIVLVAGRYLYKSGEPRSLQKGDAIRQAALASDHSPALGDPGAKVHVVEFLDPACETCAQFFPLVKQWMSENPGKIRLSVRHAPFHEGSDYVVRILEASREQGKYWQTLETLLESQALWVSRHRVQPDMVGPAIAGVGLNIEQLIADMNAAEVTRRIEQDRNDAIALQVTATPEYFVNGRPLTSFGQQQLQSLVSEELQNAY